MSVRAFNLRGSIHFGVGASYIAIISLVRKYIKRFLIEHIISHKRELLCVTMDNFRKWCAV